MPPSQPYGKTVLRRRLHRIDNVSRLKGVRWKLANAAWCATIKANAKNRHLGYFEDKERAHLAYCEASLSLHGEFGNTKLPAPCDKPAAAVLMYRYRFTYQRAATLGARSVGVLLPAIDAGLIDGSPSPMAAYERELMAHA